MLEDIIKYIEWRRVRNHYYELCKTLSTECYKLEKARKIRLLDYNELVEIKPEFEPVLDEITEIFKKYPHHIIREAQRKYKK